MTLQHSLMQMCLSIICLHEIVLRWYYKSLALVQIVRSHGSVVFYKMNALLKMKHKACPVQQPCMCVKPFAAMPINGMSGRKAAIANLTVDSVLLEPCTDVSNVSYRRGDLAGRSTRQLASLMLMSTLS